MKILSFLIILTLSINHANAQRRYTSINRLGAGVDITFAQIQSDAITSTAQVGYAGYLETRGEFRRSLDLIYSIGIFNHNMQIQEFATPATIDASMLGAQLKLLLALRPFKNDIFTIEAGPALLFNGELKFDDVDAARLAGDIDPIALSELEKTNPINLSGVLGFSLGTSNVRATAHYQYAFFNLLEGVDIANNDLQANLSSITAGLRFYF